MWFLLVEIFFLIAVAFMVGSGITALALRILLRRSDNVSPDAVEPARGGVKS